jgi:hypothetical protein
LCGPLSSEDQLIDIAKETMPASSCGFFAATRLKIIRANDSGAASQHPSAILMQSQPKGFSAKCGFEFTRQWSLALETIAFLRWLYNAASSCAH